MKNIAPTRIMKGRDAESAFAELGEFKGLMIKTGNPGFNISDLTAIQAASGRGATISRGALPQCKP